MWAVFGAGNPAYEEWLTNYNKAMSKIPYRQMPQELADELAHEAQLAVAWFHDRSTTFNPVVTEAEVTNEQVKDRIQGFQYAMDREIARIHGFEYNGGWNWRFDDDWRTKHNDWIEQYMIWEKDKNPQDNRRYDLTALPWNIQRALCTRWQRIWETWRKEKSYDPASERNTTDTASGDFRSSAI